MLDLPVGTLTFLFTDIEGSTRLWEQHTDAMRLTLARHDQLLRAAIETNNGQVFKTIGDAFCAVFATATDALNAVVAAQDHLAGAIPAATTLQLRVRMALHTGVAEKRNADYFGPTVNRIARLIALGHGDQILISDATVALLRGVLPKAVTLHDLGLHSLRDLPQPERIHQLVRPGFRSDFPPLHSLHATVYNLSQELSAFVGREDEITTWQGLLRQPRQRLFTVTGFGGMGKTRIAMSLAECSLPYFPDGVWWCEQEHSRTGEEMLQHLTEQLCVPLQPEIPVKEQVRQYLRERNLLLALDNLEQVEGAAEVVRDLLQAAPGVKILATSRRALDLRGETLLELNPMAAHEAVALFVERAQSLRPDFSWDAANDADVQALCRELEGVPLAIELAAARCIGMTPRQIRQRLKERFRLLQSRSPDLSPRLRALRSAIDWSYCLLREEERRIFAQLSIFMGGFTLEDAEAVCDGWDVLESVLELRKSSFFRTEMEADTRQARFVMLESLREYAAEQLVEADEECRQVGQRHAEYFRRLAREQVGKFRSSEELQAVGTLEQQSANLNAALQWARQAHRPALFADLACLTGHRLLRRGFLREAAEVVQEGLVMILPLRAEYPALTAELLREHAGLHLDLGETEEAERLAKEALALASQSADATALALAENLLGQADLDVKNFPDARNHFTQALAHATRANATILMANIYNNLGIVERRDTSDDAAEQTARRAAATTHLQTSLRLRRAHNDRRGLSETLNSLGALAFEADRYEDAWSYYAEALKIQQELQNTRQIGLALFNLSEVMHKQGDSMHAVSLLVASENLLIESQFPYVSIVTQMLQEAAAKANVSLAAVVSLQAAFKTQPLKTRIAFDLQTASNTADAR